MKLSRRTGRLLLFAALAGVAVGIVVLRRLRPTLDTPGTGAVLRVMSPAIRALGAVDRGLTGAAESVLGLATARREVEHLRQQNAELRREIADLGEAMRRVGQWPALVAAAELLTRPTVAAELLARGGDSANPSVIVNAGEDEGVVMGCPAVTPQGLAGRVMLTTAHTSVVRLLNAESMAVSALLLPGNHPGVVRGLGAGGRLEFLPEDQGAVVQVGQVIISAGDEGSFFPRGLPIGTVAEIGTTDRGLRRCLVAPAADLRRSSDLLLIIGETPRLRPLEGRRLISGAMASAEAQAEQVSTESMAAMTSLEVIAVAASADIEAVEASLEAAAASGEAVASPEAD